MLLTVGAERIREILEISLKESFMKSIEEHECRSFRFSSEKNWFDICRRNILSTVWLTFLWFKSFSFQFNLSGNIACNELYITPRFVREIQHWDPKKMKKTRKTERKDVTTKRRMTLTGSTWTLLLVEACLATSAAYSFRTWNLILRFVSFRFSGGTKERVRKGERDYERGTEAEKISRTNLLNSRDYYTVLFLFAWGIQTLRREQPYFSHISSEFPVFVHSTKQQCNSFTTRNKKPDKSHWTEKRPSNRQKITANENSA